MVVLHCHTSNLRPHTSQAQPSIEILTLTAIFLSTNVKASVTSTGKDDPKLSTTWFGDLHIICTDWFDRPDTLIVLEVKNLLQIILIQIRNICKKLTNYFFLKIE